ncbi:uncharacterized protein LOC110092701 [Dendrobium catenatum]|uniref:Senescence regulator n=1 Tax=Dendrobium catenatum TaxID=906689 RepID=A0A2I0WWT4_9ASPA|nr:uncharacterized protein LOC110092701 [Dendrobium catenatum]PKU80117.1 hypothetical protein MA16_Dca024787 [Dendrobium catenatum]
MAGLKNPHRFLAPLPAAEIGCDDDFDFDESDIWGFGPEPREEDRRKPIPVRRSGKKKMEKGDRPSGAAVAAGSLPVNIPDWSKILKEENRGVVARGRGRQFLDYDEGDEEVMGSGSVIPPHELLWRRREASFSVQEGIGRTLKGRDLSRVRDAIWQRTGFQA